MAFPATGDGIGHQEYRDLGLKPFAMGAHRLLLCGACMDARGLTESDLIEGSRRSCYKSSDNRRHVPRLQGPRVTGISQTSATLPSTAKTAP